MISRRSALQAIGDVLHPADSPGSRYWFVLRFYLDTSGKQGHKVMVAAGYLATQGQWRRFGRIWSSILADAGARAFHATDFYNGRGEFAGIELNGPEHVKLAKRFTGAVAKHAGIGVAFGLGLDAFDEHLAEVMQKFPTPHDRFTPLMYCVEMCLGNTATRYLPGRQAALILENEPRLGEVLGMLPMLRKRGEVWVDSYPTITVSSKDEMPLQAADLLAHEAWRRITEQLYPTGRPQRKSLNQLIAYDNVRVTYCGHVEAEDAAKNFRRLLRTHPRYAKD